MSVSGRKQRKRNREMLDSLLQPSDDLMDESICEETAKTILFQNGEIPLLLNEASNYYAYGKLDYDEQLIGSANFWHQITVR